MKRIIVGILLLTTLAFSSCADPNGDSNGASRADATDTPDPAQTISEIDTSTEVSTEADTRDDGVRMDATSFTVYELFAETDRFREPFVSENRTYGAFYGDSMLEDTDCPEERAFVIDSQSKFDEIFVDGSGLEPLDYRTEMYVLYTFTTLYHRAFLVKEASIADGRLSVQYALQAPDEPVGDAARPFQRFVLIRMAKAEVEQVAFVDIETASDQ